MSNEPAKVDLSAVVNDIRTLNQEGKEWTDELASKISKRYCISFEKVNEWGVKIYAKYINEFNVKYGSIVQRIEFFLNDNYKFKRNIISGDLLWSPIGTSSWDICKYNDVWRFLQHNVQHLNDKRAKVNISDVTNLLESAYVPQYNPFKEYFETLPEWDGIDHIEALGNHIQCEDQTFWLLMFKKALVRMIGCSYGGYENRIICVFVQETQEQGKDTFIRFLCPPEFHNYYKEDPLEVNKDAEIALTKNFIWNLSELDHLNKKEISEIKSIISRKVINQRAAFARQAESRSRVVNWWGSTNKTEFLTDDAHTRWLCSNIKSISWAYSHDIDIQKVWAQAWHLYKSGYDYNLNSEEKSIRDKRNKEFEVMPDEKQLILTYFSKTAKGEGEFMINTEIQLYLLAVTNNRMRLSSYNIKKSMDQLNFAKEERLVGSTKLRGYWVRKKPIENQPAPSNGISPQDKALMPMDDSLELPF